MTDGHIDIDYLREVMQGNNSSLWVFGYASLIWKPGFSYKRRIVGNLHGYKRRFFQGTTTHRGTEEWPGRVATLLPGDPEDIVWGVAYEVTGFEEIGRALEHLAEREMITGGYHFDSSLFRPLDTELEPFQIQVYIADCSNKQYLGSAALDLQAYQIFRARGVCGPNVDYVMKVVDFMVNEVPGGCEQDEHLFALASRLRDFQRGVSSLSSTQLALLPFLVAEVRPDHEWAELKRRESESACSRNEEEAEPLQETKGLGA